MEKIYKKISKLSNKNRIEKILGARIAAARGRFFQICKKENFFIGEEIIPYFFEKKTIEKIADEIILKYKILEYNSFKDDFLNKIFDFTREELAEFGIKMEGEFRAECKKKYFWENEFFEDAFIYEIKKCIYLKINGKKYPEKENLRKDGSDFF